MIASFVWKQKAACARSVSVSLRVNRHTAWSDVSVSNTTAESTEQDITLTSILMYPFSLHDIRNGIQPDAFSINNCATEKLFNNFRTTFMKCNMIINLNKKDVKYVSFSVAHCSLLIKSLTSDDLFGEFKTCFVKPEIRSVLPLSRPLFVVLLYHLICATQFVRWESPPACLKSEVSFRTKLRRGKKNNFVRLLLLAYCRTR